MKYFLLIMSAFAFINATEDPTWGAEDNRQNLKKLHQNTCKNGTETIQKDDFFTNFCNEMAPIMAGYAKSQKSHNATEQQVIAPMSIYHNS